MVQLSGSYEPHMSHHEEYEFYAQQYREAYRVLHPVQHNITRHIQV